LKALSHGKLFIHIHTYDEGDDITWLNVLNVEKMSLSQERLGKWQAAQTKAAKGFNLKLDFSTVQNVAPSVKHLAKRKSKNTILHPSLFFSFNSHT